MWCILGFSDLSCCCMDNCCRVQWSTWILGGIALVTCLLLTAAFIIFVILCVYPFFCAAIFDRTGQYVITGSDDRLVKIWSSETGLCLRSCRGHEVVPQQLSSHLKVHILGPNLRWWWKEQPVLKLQFFVENPKVTFVTWVLGIKFFFLLYNLLL